jgi:hypothetical protein
MDTTGLRIPKDFAGVWIVVVPYVGEADTVALLIPELPDSHAFAFRRPDQRTGYEGIVRRTSEQLSSTFVGVSNGGFTVDLQLTGTRLVGTFTPDAESSRSVDFGRFLPDGPNLDGMWVTQRVTGAASGAVYVDTLLIKPDGRVRLTSSYAQEGVVTCAVRDLSGAYRHDSGWLILNYVWLSSTDPCPHLRLTDSIRVDRTTFTRTRQLASGELLEILTPR